MTIQMTVRLSEASAKYVDTLVAEGKASSRAAALDKMIRRQKRRDEAAHDALIYAQHGEDPEMVAFAEAALSSLQSDDLD